MLIAMALMCGPKLLLADEPTTALDVTVQAELLRLLADLRSEFGMAMIFITHDLGLVSRIADRVAVMYAGEMIEAASVDDIFGDPMHPYTQGLAGLSAGPRRDAAPGTPAVHSRRGSLADRRTDGLQLPGSLRVCDGRVRKRISRPPPRARSTIIAACARRCRIGAASP